MNNLTISVFGNQIFSEVLNEIKLLSKFDAKSYNDLNLCMKDAVNYNRLVVFFITPKNKREYRKILENNFPLIIISKFKTTQNKLSKKFVDQLNTPFKIIDFEKKVVSLLAKYEFNKSSLINLHGYVIDKNERKIKKDNLVLQLTEKEINFLILFSKNHKPVNRNIVLNKVWNYSPKSDTHTIETHIHRLRKKILEKFDDNNFIKNNDKGYYI